jgi:carboxylesterase type B
MAEAIPTTVAYKKIGDLTLYIDVYPPTPKSDVPVPAVVYFHGGGMTVGDRASWFPTWLHSTFFPTRLCMHITLTLK